jgi:peptidoglycan hydrolase-like protein with peptidoglycan-binding domain
VVLTSILFKNNAQLQACAARDSGHVASGSRGEHVARIQKALMLLDKVKLAMDGVYGPATAAAVLAYKRKRSIINTSYQKTADDIVGIMTIQSMDTELNNLPRPPTPSGVRKCTRLA